MDMIMNPPYSRVSASAENLSNQALDRFLFLGKSVLITGEEKILSTLNARDCLLQSIRLATKICQNVEVYLPKNCESICTEARALAEQVAFAKPVLFLENPPKYGKYDAILSIGTSGIDNLPWTVINSHGWLSRVSSSEKAISSQCDQYNPIGALVAASLGMADVFKRLVALKSSRGRLFDNLSFSSFSYAVGEGEGPGPNIPSTIPVDLLIVGAGAIGNAIVDLLSRFPVAGRVSIVDRQSFDVENLITCLMIGPKQIGRKKAEFVASALTNKLSVEWYAEEFSVFRKRLDKGDIPFPKLVVNGVDNIPARHQVQELWPDFIVDGADRRFSLSS